MIESSSSREREGKIFSPWVEKCRRYRFEYFNLQRIIHCSAFVNDGINACKAAPLVINRCLNEKKKRWRARCLPGEIWSRKSAMNSPWKNIGRFFEKRKFLSISFINEKDHLFRYDQFGLKKSVDQRWTWIGVFIGRILQRWRLKGKSRR